MADSELDDFLGSANQEQNLLKSLSDYLGDTPLGSLASRWLDLSRSDRIVQMEETLDHSDLLIAYPDDSDRQNAERAVTVIKETLDRERDHCWQLPMP